MSGYVGHVLLFHLRKRHVIGLKMFFSGQFKMFQSDGKSKKTMSKYPIRH